MCLLPTKIAEGADVMWVQCSLASQTHFCRAGGLHPLDSSVAYTSRTWSQCCESYNCKHLIVCRIRSAGLDSLIRLLLGVEYIQPSVASVLLQKLTEYMDDTGNVEWVDHLPGACEQSHSHFVSRCVPISVSFPFQWSGAEGVPRDATADPEPAEVAR